MFLKERCKNMQKMQKQKILYCVNTQRQNVFRKSQKKICNVLHVADVTNMQKHHCETRKRSFPSFPCLSCNFPWLSLWMTQKTHHSKWGLSIASGRRSSRGLLKLLPQGVVVCLNPAGEIVLRPGKETSLHLGWSDSKFWIANKTVFIFNNVMRNSLYQEGRHCF